jgi:hypothetical protein
MLEALIAAAGVGFLLGLRFRVPAVVAASAVVAAATLALALFRGAPLWVALTAPIGAIVALQVGYLVALVLTHNPFRQGSWEDAEADDCDQMQRPPHRQALGGRVAPDGGTREREPSARTHQDCLARG